MLTRVCWIPLLFALTCSGQTVGFADRVQPLLIERCQACHGGDKRSGGLTIRDYGEMLKGGRSGAPVIPGNSKQSLLLHRVNGERGPVMPLGGNPLSTEEIALISKWIDEGARLTKDSPTARIPWKPILGLTVPAVPQLQSASAHPVDRFLASYFQSHQVQPKPIGSDSLFARRAYLDVWGLLPSPEQLTAFLEDRSPNKRAKLVDSLLAENQKYADHWITFWNDLLRNDGGDNYHGGRKSITEWLHRSLANNLSYDRFVTELLNPSTPSSPDGFLMGVNWRGDVNASQLPVMQAAQNSAQVFLGINLKCNSCHDSFISSWKLQDAYSLAAYFAEKPKLELVRCDNPTGKFATASFLYPELNPEGPVPEALNDRRALVARMFTDPRNGRTPRTVVNRYWQRLLGRGIVGDLDDLDAEPWYPELLDWLASDFVAHGSDLKHLLRTIMTSEAYQMPAVRREGVEREYVFRGPEFRRLTAEEFVDALGAITGEWQVSQQGIQGRYSRDWVMPASNLSKALGRPVRDQVYTERDCIATTLQALELVNGEKLTRMLNRGARRMLGQLNPPPENLFDSGSTSSARKPVEIDLIGVEELHLVVADSGSYSPERVLPVWADAMVEKNGEWIPLAKDRHEPVQLKGAKSTAGMRVTVPSDLTFDLRGKGYTRFRATTGVEESCLQSDISPSVRFFLFRENPDPEHLVKVTPERPVPTNRIPSNPDAMVRRLWMQALGRQPSAVERQIALDAVRSPQGLADLLWSLMMLPEFQLL